MLTFALVMLATEQEGRQRQQIGTVSIHVPTVAYLQSWLLTSVLLYSLYALFVPLCFGDSVTCNLGWLQTFYSANGLPASISQVLGLQTCTNTPGLNFLFVLFYIYLLKIVNDLF